MFCVNCGVLLQGGNRVGLVCQPCKQVRENKRRSETHPLVIRYCFRCGNPYHPCDNSIQHPCCGVEHAEQNLAFALRQHDFRQKEEYAQ